MAEEVYHQPFFNNLFNSLELLEGGMNVGRMNSGAWCNKGGIVGWGSGGGAATIIHGIFESIFLDS